MVDLLFVGLLLLIAGFVVVILSTLGQGQKGSEVRGGGVVMIGPIPIIFGSDAKWTSVAIVLAIVLVVVSLLLYLV